MRIPQPLTAASFTSIALLLAACSGGGGDGGAGTPGVNASSALRGTLDVRIPNSTVLEAEPNDTIEQAHVLGELRAGESRIVLGTITENGADQVDGFQIIAPERVLIDVTLTGITTSSDLDLYIFDPVSLQAVESFTTNSASESGTFAVQGTFFLVVDAFSGDSDYELRIEARAITAPIAEEEPNDNVPAGEYLGTLLPGQEIFVSGDGVGGSSDFFLFAVPEGTTVDFACGFNALDDYDMRVFDATANLNSPQLLAVFDAPGSVNPEVGQVTVPGMTLVAVEVFPFGGAGPWLLRLGTVAPLTQPGGLGGPVDLSPRPLSASARGSLDAQRSMMRGAVPRRMFTESVAPTVRGDLIIQLDGPSNVMDAMLAAHGGQVVQSIPDGPRKVRFALPPALTDAEASRYAIALAASLRGRAGVRLAEPDYLLQAFQTEVRPDDTHYNLQWHYEQIQLPAAWAITQGSNAVRIAVLDTGSTPASDLLPRTVQGIDMISDPQIAGDGDGIDNDPTDVGDSTGAQPSSFHGSHVAGTIGAATNNASGVAGVTWQGQVMHVRVLGIGGGSTFDILNGVLWAAGLPNAAPGVASPPADIQNLSLGGPGFSQAFQNAINQATQAGSLIIAAAGNENSSTPSYPAAYDNVISVAAVDFERSRAPYSNFHATVDIAAPGGDVSADLNGDGFADGVLSTKPDDTVTPTNFESFSFYQGTSMAAPHIAGVAALVLSVDPTLTPAQIGQILMQTATDLGTPGRDDQFGNGLVNALAAVQAAGGGGGGAPILALASSNVLFEAVNDTRRIGVLNAGGGSLQVQSPTATTNNGGTWLSAVRVAIQTPGASDTSAIDVTVSAAALPDGLYTGSVQVTSNGGTTQLSVTLALGQGSAPPTYEVFVIAIDPTTFSTVAQDVVFTSGSLGFALQSLEAGGYLVVAGTDEDGDGFICDPGEPLCGVFPSLELASIIDVTSGQTVTGLDFPLEQATLPAGGSGQQGFRLLPRSIPERGTQSLGSVAMEIAR